MSKKKYRIVTINDSIRGRYYKIFEGPRDTRLFFYTRISTEKRIAKFKRDRPLRRYWTDYPGAKGRRYV